MKDKLMAIYNTLKLLQMPPTPENAKHMAGIYITLEEVIKMTQEENGGD
jgi:hypothetical protein